MSKNLCYPEDEAASKDQQEYHHCNEENDGHYECPVEVMSKCYADLCDNSKLCLLCLSSFPKDEDISVRRLIRRWLAEGFVERRCQRPFAEDLVQKVFEDLVDLRIIQITKLKSDHSPKYCYLVSVWHDYLSPKAHIGLFYIHPNSELIEDGTAPFVVRRTVHHLSTTRPLPRGLTSKAQVDLTNVRAHKPDPSNLRSYVFFDCPHKDKAAKEVGISLTKIIKNDFRLLRVLDLEGVNNPTLPDKLGYLCNLKYLGLRRTYLDSLPESVGDLSYLETLDVKHTNVNSLPASIWKLKQLRHLYLNNIRLSMRPISSFTLFTLCGLVLDEKTSVKKGLGRLVELRELSIKFQLSTRSQGVLLDSITKLINLQSLRLISVNNMGCASKLVLRSLAALDKLSCLNLIGNLERLPTLNEFPPTLKALTLSISYLNDNPMETLGQLPCLIMLRLLGYSFMGKKMICHRGGFKKLEVLKLWNLPELVEWGVEEEAMESLKELNIRCCHMLKKIPCRLLLKARGMEELRIENMPDEFVAGIRTAKSTVRSLTIDQPFTPLA